MLLFSTLYYLLRLNSIVPCINLFTDLLIFILLRIFLNEQINALTLQEIWVQLLFKYFVVSV
jgi:hypothetical protein